MLTSCNAGVEQVSLQHGIVLGQHWDDHRRILRTLALVAGCRVGRYQRVQFVKSIGDGAASEARDDLPFCGINICNMAYVAIIDLRVVVVFDLHHLVAERKGPTEPFYLSVAGRIEHCLQFDIERPRACATSIHGTENLDVVNRVEAEAFRYSSLGQLNDAADSSFWIIGLYEIEVAFLSSWAELGHRALVDPMGVDDDSALRGLAEYFGEPHYGHGTRCDDVCKDLSRPDRRKLIDVAHDEQRSLVRNSLEQRLHQKDIDHRRFVDDQQAAIERIVLATFEAAAPRIDLQQTVDGLGLVPSRLGHPFRGAPGWSAK